MNSLAVIIMNMWFSCGVDFQEKFQKQSRSKILRTRQKVAAIFARKKYVPRKSNKLTKLKSFKVELFHVFLLNYSLIPSLSFDFSETQEN
jgi:hypothetical protein